jgi:hypothetical protein
MSDSRFSAWLAANKTVAGLLALVVSAPGEAAQIEQCASAFAGASFEIAWRSLAETIPVLQLNNFPTGCFRFVFEHAFVHCERREDGVCIGLFVRRGPSQLSTEGMDRLLAEFHAL